jgi:hypothetical protein
MLLQVRNFSSIPVRLASYKSPPKSVQVVSPSLPNVASTLTYHRNIGGRETRFSKSD